MVSTGVKIILRPDTIDQLVFDASPERTKGLHVSQIIKSICAELDPKRFAHTDDLPWALFETGFTFERVLEMAFAARLPQIFRPGEITLDGVIMSPDGIDPDGSTFSFRMSGEPSVLEEYKFTKMSSSGAPDSPKFFHWFVQMKAYCLALGTPRARLRALFINGDYRLRDLQYKVWDIEFTEDELQENWQMLVSHARMKGWL